MNKKEKEILSAIGDLDGELIESARPKGRASRLPLYRVLSVAACLVIMVGITLAAVLSGLGNQGNIVNPSNPTPPDKDQASPEFLAAMRDYLFSAIEPEYGVGDDDNMEGSGSGNVPNGGTGSNGNYFEVTDNQIAGIVEGDLAKATDKYIFRFADMTIYIYSMAGEDSEVISFTDIEKPDDFTKFTSSPGPADMFLSQDGNTVTLFISYYTKSYALKTGVISVDVSDVKKPVTKSVLSLGGAKQCARYTDGKFYLVTSWYFAKNRIDLDDPASFVPGVDYENGRHTCSFEDIVYPPKIESASYHYLAVLDEESLDVIDDKSVVGEYNDVYFTDNHILFTYENVDGEINNDESNDEDLNVIIDSYLRTKIHLLDFSGGGISYRGELEIDGSILDQYSIDEHKGHLRIVATKIESSIWWMRKSENASLYVFRLDGLSLVASVIDFAPEGEGVTSARFEDDSLYVCTAEVVTFSDPVYFFDLSDYDNITQVNTGFIEGFSSSLIDLGEGYLLGVGREDSVTNKLEVYKQEGDKVVSVAEYLFYGGLMTDYKTFLINREENIFGFAVGGLNSTLEYVPSASYYIIVQFDGEKINELCRFDVSGWDYNRARAVYHDGYFYLTLSHKFYFKKADIN